MHDERKRAQEMTQAVAELNRQELIRLYVAGAENHAFQLGISCGFLFCEILGFLMRCVLSPGLRSKRMAGHE